MTTQSTFSSNFDEHHRIPHKRAAVSIPPSARDRPLFVFSEEPLGVSAEEGLGYFQGGSGLVFGPSNRYLIERKLGFGTASSVWLARDLSENKHVAIKILSGYATQMNKEHNLRELEVLQCLTSNTPRQPDHCARLVTHFIHQGIEDDGEHLCLVMNLFQGSVQGIREAIGEAFIPIPTVKRILLHVLLGIAHLHKCGVAHTDIKPDNIMIDLEDTWTTEAIDSWIKANPPRTYPPERSVHKMVTPFVTESSPLPTLEALASSNFKLADFSNAQFFCDQTTDDIVPFDLRPPEIVLGDEWDESVDIWTYGCLVFTLLTGRPLFALKPSPEDNASETDVLLYQMILFCGEFFRFGFLSRCTHTMDYFRYIPSSAVDADGDHYFIAELKKFQLYPFKPFQKCLLDGRSTLSSEDVEGISDLMSKCLRLDPKDRSTAKELLRHPWLAFKPL